MFRELCGEKNMGNVVLATTMWDSVEQSRGEEREVELKTKDSFWRRLLRNGASISRHDKGMDSALHMIKLLVEKKHPAVFNIQTEMVDKHKRLDQTSAGRGVEADLEWQCERYENELRPIKEDMKDALVAKKTQLSKELQLLRADNERKLQEEQQHQASQDDLHRQKEDQWEADRQEWETLLESERSRRAKEKTKLQTEVSQLKSELTILQSRPSIPLPVCRLKKFKQKCCKCSRRTEEDLMTATWYVLKPCRYCTHSCGECKNIQLSPFDDAVYPTHMHGANAKKHHDYFCWRVDGFCVPCLNRSHPMRRSVVMQ